MPMPSEPKFRPECECGKRAPRWTTAWTAQKWMNSHIQEHANAKGAADA